jgi:hypothetical protein
MSWTNTAARVKTVLACSGLAASQRLLRQATAAQRSHPTYYGGAWQALGSALLSGGSLGAC